MWTLALDTAGTVGGIALLQGGRLIEQVLLEEPENHSVTLFLAVRELLARHHLELRDMGLFAAAAGPGSFTGVRIALTAVKAWAEALQRPAYGVSNLQALAASATAPLRAPIIDARRNEVFAAVYDASGQLVSPEVVTKLDPWLATRPHDALLITALPLEGARPAPPSVATEVGQIAWARHQSGDPGNPAAIDANYVRRSDAELAWVDRN